MNFNRLFILLFLVSFSMPVLAENSDPFAFSYQDPNPMPEDFAKRRNEYIAELKHAAVVKWLENYLGEDEYLRLQSQITSKFTLNKISAFRLTRAEISGDSYIQLTGSIDEDSIKEWISLNQAKEQSGSLRPLMIISSMLPGYTIRADQDPFKLTSNVFAQTVTTKMSAILRKFNIRPGTGVRGRFSLASPAVNRNQIASLRDAAYDNGYNSAAWVHFAPCSACGGAKLSLYFYHLKNSRVPISQSHNVKLKPSDMSNPDKLHDILQPPFAKFQSAFKKLVTSGVLFSTSYRVTIEGLRSYSAYRELQNKIQKLRFVKLMVPRMAASHRMEFEVKSTVGIEEFSRRIESTTLEGFKLKTLRVDSDVLYMRYLKL